MRYGKRIFAVALGISAMLIAASCGSNNSASSGGNTYGSTSTKGDFAQWTVNGGNVSVVWNATDATGAIAKTLNISATCGGADATYGYQTCTVSAGATCTNGTQTCSASDAPPVGQTFQMLEVPGVAVLVHVGSGGASGNEQVHVGFSLNTSCAAVNGDYSFLHLGNSQRELFGVYRTANNFASLTHSAFYAGGTTGGNCSGATTGNCTQTPAWTLNDSAGNNWGNEPTITPSCTNGVRTLTLSGGTTVRAVQSTGGAFIIDLPSGQGGIVGMPVTQAAGIADFASKNFVGIQFPDNGGPQLMAVTMGAAAGGVVPITSIAFQGGGSSNITNPVVEPFSVAASTAASPAYPDGTASVANYTGAGHNALATTYPTPSAIPGLFKVDGTFAAGNNSRIIMVAMTSAGKTLAFGTVYNWRSNQGGGNGYGYSGADYVNSGAFIIFQK